MLVTGVVYNLLLRSIELPQGTTVPWSSIKRMRDRLARHHEGTDYEAVWDTLAIDLPAIRAQIAAVREGEPG